MDDLEAKARAAKLAIAEPDGSMTLVERDRTAYQFRLATTPAAVLELVERLRAAEGKLAEVRDWSEMHVRERHRCECACVLAISSCAVEAKP